MAIKTDDPDIRPAWMRMELGGNGDYYLTIIEIKDQYDEKGNLRKEAVAATMRFATSGSKIPLEIREKITEIFRFMEQNCLDEYPDEEIYKVISQNP